MSQKVARDNIDFFRWCMTKLTLVEFGAYAILLEIGECEGTLPGLAEVAGITKRQMSNHLRTLQKKGFIGFSSYSGGGNGIDLYWIRRSVKERPPKAPCKTFIDPEGTKHLVEDGKLSQFACQQGLKRVSLSNLYHGRNKSLKGWKVEGTLEASQ
jgi:hypothetical protein